MLLDQLRAEIASSQKAAEGLIAQLADGINLARKVNASAFVFATLYSEVLPQSVITFLHAADRGHLRTALLTKEDLVGESAAIKASLA